ncbi:MAG: prevent-host-death family protein [Phycisphaerales bacterium]|nr:prevent-host-death family protein [Phycisphaerales bacterium]
MLKINDITSLTEFQRNAKAHVKRLKRTGRPEVLTINGKPEVIVQDAASYQKLVDAAELAHTLPALRASLKEADRGEGVRAATVLAQLREKLGIKR